ncbi:DUF1127 domain-containing protein [Chachezhania sediminis]|uniref:DUF1127 domain-containing protein n=1 Tax=Chachezhania sediminis TaxID=2599291 RepID=UPI00131CE5FD|nr:DUF1127 domain-containing protein [Chachezhania sediminis]
MTHLTMTRRMPRFEMLNPFSHLMYLSTVRRERDALSKLDARALEDVGLNADEAHAEASRSFWDAPAHWTR